MSIVRVKIPVAFFLIWSNHVYGSENVPRRHGATWTERRIPVPETEGLKLSGAKFPRDLHIPQSVLVERDEFKLKDVK